MRGLVIAIAAVAACSRPVKRTGPAQHTDPLPPRAGAPTVVWDGAQFTTPGLPAIARHLELAVVPHVESDGGRGFPNLAIEVRDRSDKVIQTIAVMDSNDYETMVVDGKPSAALTQRIAAANRGLNELHTLHDLVALRPLELEPAADGGDRHLAIGDGLDVDFSGDHLHVFPHNSDKPLTTQSTARWLVPPGPRCATCPPCENPAYLANVYKSPDLPDALVVEVAFHGTDLCWEPGNQQHFIVW